MTSTVVTQNSIINILIDGISHMFSLSDLKSQFHKDFYASTAALSLTQKKRFLILYI